MIGQYERNTVVAGCVVRWKKGVILRKILNFIQCCLRDVFQISVCLKKEDISSAFRRKSSSFEQNAAERAELGVGDGNSAFLRM